MVSNAAGCWGFSSEHNNSPAPQATLLAQVSKEDWYEIWGVDEPSSLSELVHPDEDLDLCVTEGSQSWLSWWGTQPLWSSNSRQCGGLGEEQLGSKGENGKRGPST